MSDLEISFCGKPLALKDEESIDRLIAYLQVLKAGIQARNTLLAFTNQTAFSSASLAEVANSSPSEVTSVDAAETNPESVRLINWFEQAWATMGQPVTGATGDEFFETLLKLGFQPTANNPRAAIKTSIRINPRFRKVGVTANNAALWKLLPRSSQATSSSSTKTMGYKGPTAIPNPPAGKRVIDYILRAMNTFSDGMTTHQLVERMKEQGWETSGDALTTVGSTMRKPRYKDFFSRISGCWYLNGNMDDEIGRFLAESKPSESKPSESQIDLNNTVEFIATKQT